mgnify:CR=1 FL=1
MFISKNFKYILLIIFLFILIIGFILYKVLNLKSSFKEISNINNFTNDFRIKYYMKKSYDSIFIIKNDNKYNILDNDENLNRVIKLNYPLIISKKLNNLDYFEPFKSLLIKINRDKPSDYKNIDFLYFGGDHSQKEKIQGIISKTREIDDNNIILLRLETERHWGPIKTIFSQDRPWTEKNNKIIWRGATTGADRHKQRKILVEKYFNHPNKNIDVGFSEIVQNENNQSKNIKSKLDIKDQLKSKYIISIEGNDVASGLKWQMYSNSLVFMSKPLIESWFMEGLLKPWYHYIPLKDDYSDLEEKYNWALNHDEKCQEIISNANAYVHQFLDESNEILIMEEILNRYLQNVKFV